MRTPSSCWLRLGGLIVCALLSSFLVSPTMRAAGGQSGPLFGLQPFPYDFTLDALNKVHVMAAAGGTLAIVHRDNGIPWAEALNNTVFPASVEDEWADLARRVPLGRATYLALGPLAEDRVSLAPPSQGSSMPRSIRDGALDSSAVKTAYFNYARRAVARFRPRFLNLGIEAGEMAARAPERWPAFVELYDYVRTQLKKEHPDLLIGISFGLQTLMNTDVAARAEALVESSDYLGLSFYPYMSPFYERFGAAPLSAPPGEWRDALAWAARYSSKPIAICETGYSSRDVHLPAYDLRLSGSSVLQEQYVHDLVQTAQQDRYLFVAWSIPVDYDALYRRLPPGDGRYILWQNIGLFDGELRPRPAWSAWLRLFDRGSASMGARTGPAASSITPGEPEAFRSASPPALTGRSTEMTAPLALMASRSGSGVVLTWLPPVVGTPQRYAIAIDAASGRDRLPVVLIGGDSTSYTIPGLPDGAYTFRVYAVGADGFSPASVDATVTKLY